jgi:predicted nuclease of predicted toxin-antitoxin system
VPAFYADENFPVPVVEILRRAGHDVLTAFEAGQANQRIPDDKVLEFATQLGRCVLTQDRWDFTRLHDRQPHAGIVACTLDDDDNRLAAAIDAAVRGCPSLPGSLLRVNRPSA